MKKTLAILFSAALICCTFTACGDKKKGNSTTESNTMAPTDSDSGLNSATDASQESAMDITDGTAADITKNTDDSSEGIIGGLVSDGEKIIDDAGSAIENAGDALTEN